MDKRLLNSLKINRNPRFEYSNINSSEIFLNPFFNFCQHWLQIHNFLEGLLKVFSAFHGIFLRIRLLDFFGG